MVHSEKINDNVECVGGQVIANPKENELQVPPKASGRGPSRIDVKSNEGIEITAKDADLKKDGQLVEKDEITVVKFEAKDFNKIEAKYSKEKTKKKTTKASKSAKGHSR